MRIMSRRSMIALGIAEGAAVLGISATEIDKNTVIRWIKDHAHPLVTLDPQAPLTDLRPLRQMVRHATVVGLGGSARGAHELEVLQHRVLRLLVEELGFRSLALEEDWTNGIRIDEYVRTGRGDPRAVLADAWVPWRTQEMLGVLRWMRSYNEQHPLDPVRVVGLDIDAVRAVAYDAVADYVRRTAPRQYDELEAHYVVLRPTGEIAEHVQRYRSQQDKRPFIDHARMAYDLVNRLPDEPGRRLALQHARVIVRFHEYHALSTIEVDEQFAENLIWWHKYTDTKLVYWGGISHAAAAIHVLGPGHDRGFKRRRSAGSLLRDHFGRRYASVGLTFHHGSVPGSVPPPPSDFADAVLGSTDLSAYLLDLHSGRPEAVRRWLEAPTKLRLIGPGYKPEADAAYYTSGGSLANWFDIIIHSRKVTPTRPLA